MKDMQFKADFPTETIVEGDGKFLVPKLKEFRKSPSDYAPSKAPVFYNPVMELNRDIAVVALQAYQQMTNMEVSACEPLGGCGIRGVRLAVEVKGVREVVIGDISEKASQIAQHNACLNGLGGKVTVKNEDANLLLSRHSAPHKRFDMIDLDPFGSPVPYIDSAIRALRDNGLLALTATDMAPLCGVHPKACMRKYGGKPLRTEYCHELAIRLLAGCLATTAAKHEIGVRVVFSYNAEHYVRVYSTLEHGARKADESLRNMGYVFHCFKCFHRESLEGSAIIGHSAKCSECNSKLSAGGPMWIGRLLDRNFCELMEEDVRRREFRTRERIEKMLVLAKNETESPIGYYVVDKLCDSLNLPVPSVKKVIEALRRNGFEAIQTRFSPKGIKSNAPATTIKRLLQEATAAIK
jgi:tRNA (guanine26-N2/guanine27-N2)-dimethyltransferase